MVVEKPDGRRWADIEVGDRNENTFQRLYTRLPDAELQRNDAYGVYRSWLASGDHVVGKGGTVNWNEGLHSWLRSKLNRPGRGTKGYTKSAEMPVYSVALLLSDWTSKPNNSLC